MLHSDATAPNDAAWQAAHLSTARECGIVWLGAALLAAVLQAEP